MLYCQTSPRRHYVLLSLVSIAVTVILTRGYLQLTGFLQIGNSVLNTAHTLWGGLLLFVIVLFHLALANRWAIQASALLTWTGIGLFIDKMGKPISARRSTSLSMRARCRFREKLGLITARRCLCGAVKCILGYGASIVARSKDIQTLEFSRGCKCRTLHCIYSARRDLVGGALVIPSPSERNAYAITIAWSAS